jgi:hypothetical protein
MIAADLNSMDACHRTRDRSIVVPIVSSAAARYENPVDFFTLWGDGTSMMMA